MEVTEACSSRNRSNRTPLGDIKGFLVSVVFSYFCVYVCYVLTHFSLQSGGMRTLEKLFELVTNDCFYYFMLCLYFYSRLSFHAIAVGWEVIWKFTFGSC